MKTKNKNKNNKNQKSDFVIHDYFHQKFINRFYDVDFSSLSEIIKFSKKYNLSNISNCPYKVVINKLRNADYPHSVYLVNPKYNMIIVSENHQLINVLYLDGRDGYSSI